ncbi:MAG TPA: class I SAM-dependent methyltransferase [Micropepsaceae bacterium]|jgi:SAM-dependent methyltransferase
MSANPLRSCPLCLSSQSEEVQTQILSLAGLGTVELGFGYCRACGHIHQVRPAPAHILSENYAAYSNYTCFDPAAARAAPPAASTRRLVTLAEARAPRTGKIYEVGCATGFHLAHFRHAGWEVAGCDPSPKAKAQANDIFGIAVDCGMEEDILPRQSDLAVVLFSHVLEHLDDPLAALKRARHALRDDGVVLLEVPCAISAHLMPPGWFTFEHLHYFSENSLLRMLSEAGLAPVEMRIAFKAEIYPVIAVIAGKSETFSPPAKSELHVAQARQFLAELVARDDALWNATSARLQAGLGRVYVWGAGVHTAQLFDRTPLLQNANVVGIIDRDNQKWGRSQANREIIGPDDFFARYDDEPVIIYSFASEAQIAQSLMDRDIARNRIVRLYG